MNPTIDVIKKEILNIYQYRGYNDRQEYLLSLSEEYEMEYEDVASIADVLGESEDFDGLLSALDDWNNMNSAYIEYSTEGVL